MTGGGAIMPDDNEADFLDELIHEPSAGNPAFPTMVDQAYERRVTETMPTPTLRRASRILLIDDADRLLLFRANLGDREVWITPGGGLDEGETFEQAALRELWEETGITDVVLGPCVWTRTHTFTFYDRVFTQHERYFVVRTHARAISQEHWDEEEQRDLVEVHWWTLAELEQSPDTFAPRTLAALLPPILAGQHPTEPIDAGV
jgi:8-oxo-dGTP pyrophosphatase MutT (NUDIX family)